jgi:hypothetical protein
MQRYDRSRFVAFGVLPILNLLGLLLYGLMLSTSSTGGAGRSIPTLLVIAGICALIALAATIKRGRDIGWPAWQTAILFWVTLSLGPAVLALLGYFAFAKPKEQADRFGLPPSPATLITWYWAVLNLLWPWMVLTVLSKVL